MEIKLADLILCKGTGPISRVIEDITDSPYSHTAGYVKKNELIEAQGFRKTGFQGLDYYAGIADVLTCDLATAAQRREVVHFVTAQVGTRYDYLLLVWEFARYVLHWTWPYYEGKNRICATLWADAYRYVGIDLCPGIIYPSPGDLAQSKLLRKVGSI